MDEKIETKRAVMKCLNCGSELGKYPDGEIDHKENDSNCKKPQAFEVNNGGN